MKLFAISVFYKGVKPVHKKATYELSSFGFFQRGGWVRTLHLLVTVLSYFSVSFLPPGPTRRCRRSVCLSCLLLSSYPASVDRTGVFENFCRRRALLSFLTTGLYYSVNYGSDFVLYPFTGATCFPSWIHLVCSLMWLQCERVYDLYKRPPCG